MAEHNVTSNNDLIKCLPESLCVIDSVNKKNKEEIVLEVIS